MARLPWQDLNYARDTTSGTEGIEGAIKLYDELEKLTGQSCGIHRPGGIYLASTPERLDYLKQERAKARYMGLATDFISHARPRTYHNCLPLSSE